MSNFDSFEGTVEAENVIQIYNQTPSNNFNETNLALQFVPYFSKPLRIPGKR